nr:hypothetical protein [Saccharothrix sp. ST-888]
MAAGGVGDGDGEEGFPDVGGPVGDSVGHLGPGALDALADGVGPGGEAVAQDVALGFVGALAELLDRLIGGAAAHPDDDGAAHDGVGQVAEAAHGEGGVDGELLDHVVLAVADAAEDAAGAAVAGVDEAAQFLVAAGSGAEDGVDLVEQHGGSGIPVADGSEQRGLAGVNGDQRPGDQGLHDLQGAGLAAGGLRGEECQTGRGPRSSPSGARARPTGPRRRKRPRRIRGKLQTP